MAFMPFVEVYFFTPIGVVAGVEGTKILVGESLETVRRNVIEAW